MIHSNIYDLAQRGAAGLEDLADVAITGISSSVSSVVTISDQDSEKVLVSDKYYGDAANKLYLDLRDLVKENTVLRIPGLNDQGDAIVTGEPSIRIESDARIRLRVSINNASSYMLNAFPFSFFPRLIKNDCLYVPAIDKIRIPKDALIPFSIFHTYLGAHGSRRFTINFISATRNEAVIDHELGGDEAMGAAMVSCLLRLADLPYAPGEPFYLMSAYTDTLYNGTVITKRVTSPVFVPCMEEMEQYAFLNPSGVFDCVPMSGTLRDIPEYDIDVLQHSSGFEKVSGSSADLHTQNTGPMSYRTAKALASYMLSDTTYHFDATRGVWRRIVIESPAVDLPRFSGVYSFTFNWRYADNDGLDNL